MYGRIRGMRTLWIILFVTIVSCFPGIRVWAAQDFSLTAAQTDSCVVTIEWRAGKADASYALLRSVDDKSSYRQMTELTGAVGRQSYEDDTVKVGHKYFYKIQKIKNGELLSQSAAVSVRVTLFYPQEITPVETKSGDIKLTWEKVAKAKYYTIYRQRNGAGSYRKLKTVTGRSYIDAKTKEGCSYAYVIKASDRNKQNTSQGSEPVYCYRKMIDFAAEGTYTKSKKIKLTWNTVAAADAYEVYRKNAKGEYKLLDVTDDSTFVDKNVKKDRRYYYKIKALIEQGNGKTLRDKSEAFDVYTDYIDPNKKMIALTFDDGPGRYTQEIVDCLKKNDAHATFFVLGCNVDRYAGAMKHAYRIGCEIGNHSYNHTILTRLSAAGVKKQMSDTDAKVKKVIGKKTKLMRCPGGGFNATVKKAVGKPMIQWSIDTLDWKTRSTEKTIAAVMNHAKDGDIVLMHDIHEPTKRAALSIIPQLKKKG